MVTRSQAKRKAEEELVGSPSKSARSSDSDSKKRTSQNDNAALNPGNGRSSGDRFDKNSEFSGRGNADESAESAAVQSQKKQSMRQTATAADSEHTSDDIPEQRKEGSQQQQEVDEHPAALEFAKHLQLIIEKRRAVGTGSTTPRQASLQMERIAHLCELASGDGIRRDMFLGIFPTQWWEDMRDLKRAMQELQDSEKLIQPYEDAFDKTSEKYLAIVAQRGAALLGEGPNGPEMAKQAKLSLNQSVLNARRNYNVARNDWDIMREKRVERQAGFDQILTKALDEAEKSLEDAQYLRYWFIGQSQDAEPAQSEKSRRARSSSEMPRQDERPAQRQSPRQQDHDERVVVEDIVAGLRKDQRHELERTRLAYFTATEKFAAVRSKYYRKLVDFLQKKNQDAVYGTRTDFDNRYFIERNRANREVAVARDMYDFALEEADKTGALSVEQRVWAFNDEADSGRGSGNGRLIQVLRDMINERVESWRRDEGQKEIASERHWPAMLTGLNDEEGVSLCGLSQWSEDQGRATGTRRRLIDDWQRQQERVRKKTAFAVLPTMAGRGAELQWYEGFNGL